MRLLLDTQIYLWFVADSGKLSKQARRKIIAADEVYVSAASIWETSIKAALGKISVDLEDLVDAIGQSGFVELPILARHAVQVAALPPHHRDPFDRMLIAQAVQEPMHLLTADKALKPYSDLIEVV
jgi:PIN domain nuclease of toxin-antitoxin system